MTTDFYSTHGDLIDLFAEVEQEVKVKYAPIGQHTERPTTFPLSLSEVDLQMTYGVTGDRAQLIFPRDEPVVIVEQPPFRRAPTRYSISHIENGKTVTLIPGGEFANVIIILGSIVSDASRGWSRDMGRLLRQIMKRRWRRSEWLWLSPASEALYRGGWRLNRNIKSAPQTDFIPVPTDPK